MRSHQRNWNLVCSFLVIIAMLISLGTPPAAFAFPGLQPNGPEGDPIDLSRLASSQPVDPIQKIEPLVLDQIQANGKTDFFIWLKDKADLSEASQLDSQAEKGEFVYASLWESADQAQAGVLAVLDQAGIDYQAYTVVDRVLARGGSRDLALAMASRPEVERLTANHIIQLDPQEQAASPEAQILGVGSNLSFIKVDQVWAMGYTGAGIVLADQDTGFQWNHPALINHYRGWNGASANHNYNWWDATGTYPAAPDDGHGHGTHTAGTMLGDDGAGNQIGVAPGAKLIGCKSFSNTGSANDANVLTCFEWFLAPWDLSHNNPDPSKAPNAINNSWGWNGGNHTTFAAAINTLQAAGILVTVSAGNEGPACQTLGSPGDYDNVLTTGNVAYSGQPLPGTIYSSSSRGASKITPGSFIPDVMAPGVSIRSSIPGSSYGNMTGTSMSNPHVAGLVALLWSAAPSLKGHIPETVAVIRSHAVPLIGQAGSNCGGNYTIGPNNDWGIGTIDALATVLSSTTGILNGKVINAANLAPLAGVTVRAGVNVTTSAADGSYALAPLAGSYTVTASKGGFVAQSVSGVVIVAGLTSTVNISLSAAAPTRVTGTVRDGTALGHTFPIYTRIDFATPDLPVVSVYTDPFSGVYSANLLMSTLYTASFTPAASGYLPSQPTFTATSNPFTRNFTLSQDAAICTAPGYTKWNVDFLETFDSVAAPALPAGWAVAQIGGITDATWTTRTQTLHPSGQSPLSAPNLIGFNSYDAASGHQALLYRTTGVDLSARTSAVITFWMYHDSSYSSSQDTLQAAISTNGSTFYLIGTTIQRYSSTPGWTVHEVDISSYAGSGKPAVYIGFIGASGYGNDIHLDNVTISGPCQSIPGGMVGGLVSTAQTGTPIISALVASVAAPAENAYSYATPGDPLWADGLYLLFTSQPGAQNFSATAIRHYFDQRGALVTSEAITRLDFSLTSARLSASPNPVSLTLPAGFTSNLSLTLSNPGSLDAAFVLQPAASAITSGSTSNAAPPYPYRVEPASGPAISSSPGNPHSGLSPDQALFQPEVGYAPQGGGPRTYGTTTPFPGSAGYRMASASCDGEVFYVFGGQTGSTPKAETWLYTPSNNRWFARAPMPVALANMRAACIDGKIYLVGGYSGGSYTNDFSIYDTTTDSWTHTTQPVTGAPMVVAYNGLLYIFGGASSGGASNLAYQYDPATTLWSPLANLPTATSYAGAIVYQNFIFILGGYDTADIQRYTPASNSWNNGGPDLPGSRMDPVVGWYGNSIYIFNGGGNGTVWQPYSEGYLLDPMVWPGGSLLKMTQPLTDPQVAGASICAANRLWSVGGTISTTEDHVTQYYDGGLMCNRTFPTHPWLTVAPGTGTVAHGGSSVLPLGFNASALIPGVYRAVIKVNTDAPYALSDIPVTLIVVQISAYLSLAPNADAKSAVPGHDALYTFTLTNTGASTESFAIAYVAAPAWSTAVTYNLTNVSPGGIRTFTVRVTVPTVAADGASDNMSLKVAMVSNPARYATLSVITTAQRYRVSLPVVMK